MSESCLKKRTRRTLIIIGSNVLRRSRERPASFPVFFFFLTSHERTCTCTPVYRLREHSTPGVTSLGKVLGEYLEIFPVAFAHRATRSTSAQTPPRRFVRSARQPIGTHTARTRQTLHAHTYTQTHKHLNVAHPFQRFFAVAPETCDCRLHFPDSRSVLACSNKQKKKKNPRFFFFFFLKLNMSFF